MDVQKLLATVFMGVAGHAVAAPSLDLQPQATENEPTYIQSAVSGEISVMGRNTPGGNTSREATRLLAEKVKKDILYNAPYHPGTGRVGEVGNSEKVLGTCELNEETPLANKFKIAVQMGTLGLITDPDNFREFGLECKTSGGEPVVSESVRMPLSLRTLRTGTP